MFYMYRLKIFLKGLNKSIGQGQKKTDQRQNKRAAQG